jgi:hypothetical protein
MIHLSQWWLLRARQAQLISRTGTGSRRRKNSSRGRKTIWFRQHVGTSAGMLTHCDSVAKLPPSGGRYIGGSARALQQRGLDSAIGLATAAKDNRTPIANNLGRPQFMGLMKLVQHNITTKRTTLRDHLGSGLPPRSATFRAHEDLMHCLPLEAMSYADVGLPFVRRRPC